MSNYLKTVKKNACHIHFKPLILMTKLLLQLLLPFAVDLCYHFKNLSDAHRKISYVPPYG